MLPSVTVVIATYNRPAALRTAILSVRAQEFPAWHLLVVGDRCDRRTSEVVAAFDDQRISYVNLALRCGEQSGPNSVGIAAARTDYIAFLNHDDAFLQDHLQHGLQQLATKSGDFFIGMSACSFRAVSADAGLRRLEFSSCRPTRRWVGLVVTDDEMFEPCSSWIIRTELARSIGYWRLAVDLHRSPLQDWLMRAWRAPARFVFGEMPSVLMIRPSQRTTSSDVGTYDLPGDEHSCIEHLLNHKSAAEIRAAIADDLRLDDRHDFQSLKRDQHARFPLKSALVAALYRHLGFDAVRTYRKLRGYDKADRHRKLLAKRVKEDLPERVAMETIVASALQTLRDA